MALAAAAALFLTVSTALAQEPSVAIVALLEQLGPAVGLLLLGAAGMFWVTRRVTPAVDSGAEQRTLALVEALTTAQRDHVAELKEIAEMLRGIVVEQGKYFEQGRRAMTRVEALADSGPLIKELHSAIVKPLKDGA